VLVALLELTFRNDQTHIDDMNLELEWVFFEVRHKDIVGSDIPMNHPITVQILQKL
jgi:hypothetical protein